MGAAFKENCSDIRNSRIFDTINYLNKNGANVIAYDPLVPINFLKKNKESFNKIKFYKHLTMQLSFQWLVMSFHK